MLEQIEEMEKLVERITAFQEGQPDSTHPCSFRDGSGDKLGNERTGTDGVAVQQPNPGPHPRS